MGAGGYVLNRNLAFEGQAFHPATPASGTPIYFELLAKGHSRIVSFDPLTRGLRTIVADATNPAISRDGARLAYLSNGKLFLDGEPIRLAVAGPIDAFGWFPDAKHLAFSSLGVIYDSRDVRRLVANVPGELSEPAVSPDSLALAFTAFRGGVQHVWVQEISTGISQEITGGVCNSSAPAWEPGLIFASDCDRGLGLPRLYRAEYP
jgi:Tol biopolymer transport system component